MSGNRTDQKVTAQPPIKCEDIQELLFDYMSRELGQARSTLVREHLRRCSECKHQAAEIQATLEMLNSASKEDSDLPSKLTDARRKKLYWWYSHPIMLWIENHHVLVSLVVTLIVIAILAVVAATAKLWEEDPPEDIYPIWIGDKLPGLTDSTSAPDTTPDGDAM